MPRKARIDRIALLACLSISLSSTAWAGDADDDKKLHFGASTLLSTGMYFMHSSYQAQREAVKKGESKGFAFATCTGIGLAKEVYDQYHATGFDMNDMTMNIAGCALGTVGAARLNHFIITPTINEDIDDEEIYGIRITKNF